jgi:hypothetical protein
MAVAEDCEYLNTKHITESLKASLGDILLACAAKVIMQKIIVKMMCV